MKSRIPGPLCAHCGTGVVLDEPASSSSDSARTSATLPRITATPGPLGISDAGDPSVIAVAASPPTSASGRDGNNDVAHLAASLFRWLQRLAKGQIAVAKNGNFYTDVIVPSPVFNSTTRISDIDYLEPVTRSAVLAIID